MTSADIPAPDVSGKTAHKKSILPPEALAQHIGILGKTGSGKTTTAKGLAEGWLKSNGLVEILGRKVKASPTLFLDAGGQAA